MADSRQKVIAFLKRLGKESREEWATTVTCIRVARQMRLNRRARGLSQQELARKSGLSFQTINRLEGRFGYGIRRSTAYTLCKVAAGLECALLVNFCSWGEWVTWIITPLGVAKTFREEVEEGKWEEGVDA